MANYDQSNRNDSEQRSGNRYDRYATGRYSDDRDRMNTDRTNNERMTGDWRDDEARLRNEQDRGFFERAADTVSSWFGGDDDDRRNDRDYDRERRYSTEGRAPRANWNSTFDTRHGANMDRDRYNDRAAIRDSWRNDYDNNASWHGDVHGSNTNTAQRFERNTTDMGTRRGNSSRAQYPERFSQDQPDGREAGRDYYNRLNDGLRSGSSFQSQNSPYIPDRMSSSNYGSYGRTGNSNFGTSSLDRDRSSDSNSRWSNQSDTYGDNSGIYGSASRGQYSGKGPKGYRRSDDRIKEDVCEYLTRNAMIDASDVEITVLEGVVTLSGTVPDRQMKRMSEDEIEWLPGVRDVNNQLRVNRESNGRESYTNSMSDLSDTTSSRSASSPNGNGSNGSSRSDNSTNNQSSSSTGSSKRSSNVS